MFGGVFEVSFDALHAVKIALSRVDNPHDNKKPHNAKLNRIFRDHLNHKVVAW